LNSAKNLSERNYLMKVVNFKSVAVVKHGKTAEGQDYVDGISGGTYEPGCKSNDV
jgi:hypothetical protein